MADSSDNQAPNMTNRPPSAPGEGGGQGDTAAKSSNPEEWKDQPGNQS